MYHKVKIGQLSNPQISRLLNGHGVRVSNGSNHEIELSKEQLKKYMKALEKSKAMTLTMDPFQMQGVLVLVVLLVVLLDEEINLISG